MTIHIISATEVSRSLSSILNKVHYRGETYSIKRGREIIAKIIPADIKQNTLKLNELSQLLKQFPTLETDDQASFGEDIRQIREQTKIEDETWD